MGSIQNIKKSESIWSKFLQTFAPSKTPITLEKVKADIIPAILDELENLSDLKVFMGPMDKKPQLLFTQVQLSKNMTIECVESSIDESFTLVIFKKQKNILRASLTKTEYRQMLTLFLDLIFIKCQKSGIDLLKAEITKDDQALKLNSIESELKSREWLRVTMEVYKKALGQIAKDRDLLLEFSLQFNLHDREPFIVFKSYNLFWQIKFLENALMRVIFYNDKEDKKENKPSLSGDFYHQKNQIWDEFINALVLINQTHTQK